MNNKSITIQRTGGLGDVCMALCAAKALTRVGYEVNFVTHPQYVELASACPHVKNVMIRPEGPFVDLNPAMYGLSSTHESLAFFYQSGIIETAIGLVPNDLSLDLSVPQKAIDKADELFPGQDFIALHAPGVDANRTWPFENWINLAGQLIMDGYTPIFIGEDKGLSHLETVALLRKCKALVSCDSGPIQLAGAAPECSVVGLYSVVPPERRKPFGAKAFIGLGAEECPFYPCYDHMKNDKFWQEYMQPRINAGVPLAKCFGDWCLNEDRYSCMKNLTVDRALKAVESLLED